MTTSAATRLRELTVVIPVYNAEGCLHELHERLGRVLRGMALTYEIVLVDDGSRDGSWQTIAEIAKADPSVKAVRLSRNFGQHAAITAGLEVSTGRWTVVMDCDLQDPPEDIPRLHAKAVDGFDVVLARRKRRQHSLFRRLAARLYFRLLGFFNQTAFDHEYGSFSIISRRVVAAFLDMKESARHYLLLLYWLGFSTGVIEYEHQDRAAGRSAYTLRRLLAHALEGVFFQTTILLRWIVYLGFAVALSGFGLALYLVARYLFFSALPGWTSLAVLILVVGGFTTVSVGVTGLYVGKIFDQVKSRPLFIVSETIIEGLPR